MSNVKTPQKGLYREHIGSLLKGSRPYVRSFNCGSREDCSGSEAKGFPQTLM